MTHFDMDGLVLHLGQVLKKQFADDISQIYYGDVVVYPPKAFQNPAGEWRTAVALVPAYDREADGGRNPASEIRDLGVLIVPMVNMTPFFEALPSEAFGERMLVRLTHRIRLFLAQRSNMTLNGNVARALVGDVEWHWAQRDKMPIRAAAITYEVQSHFSRAHA
jgi:hypothetical protein